MSENVMSQNLKPVQGTQPLRSPAAGNRPLFRVLALESLLARTSSLGVTSEPRKGQQLV